MEAVRRLLHVLLLAMALPLLDSRRSRVAPDPAAPRDDGCVAPPYMEEMPRMIGPDMVSHVRGGVEFPDRVVGGCQGECWMWGGRGRLGRRRRPIAGGDSQVGPGRRRARASAERVDAVAWSDGGWIQAAPEYAAARPRSFPSPSRHLGADAGDFIRQRREIRAIRWSPPATGTHSWGAQSSSPSTSVAIQHLGRGGVEVRGHRGRPAIGERSGSSEPPSAT